MAESSDNCSGETRILAFEGAANFRDLGGYAAHEGRRVRWRTLFRADSLADLTEGDHALLRALEVRMVCDFRLLSESEAAPDYLPADDTLAHIKLPFMPRGVGEMFSALRRGDLDQAGVIRNVCEHYRCLALDHLGEYRSFLDHLLKDQHRPAVFHCTSGKDRTGMMAAIILLALDVSRDDIFTDYLLTNDYRRDITHILKLGVDDDVMALLTSARPEYLSTALGAIEETFGSTARYLTEGLGLDDARRAELRAILLD
jgi:protein-tyrosine phosphatase